jgi:drug/metabolite transporter (DMT)-like permease
MLALSLPALLLGLVSGVLFSAADYFRKSAPRACPPDVILFYFVLGQIPLLGAWAFWNGQWSVGSGYILPGAVDAALGLGANLLMIVAIRRSALSLMIPLLALAPVLTLLSAGLVLGEWPTLRQDVGILLITAGLFALFQPADSKPSLRAAWTTLRAERGTLPMLAVVALWSTTPAIDKLCLAHTSSAMHALLQVVLIGSTLAAWMARQGFSRLKLQKDARAPIAGAAVAGALGYACQIAAYAIALVALIEVVKRIVGLAVSQVLGRAAFREPVTTAKIAGIAIIAVGLPLVMIT